MRYDNISFTGSIIRFEITNIILNNGGELVIEAKVTVTGSEGIDIG